MLRGIGITPVHIFFSSNAGCKWYLMLCLYLPAVTESTYLLDLSHSSSVLSWWWKRGFSQLREMILQQPLWLEQWTLSALLACWPCGDWVPWSFAHPLCTLDTHRERDPPPPTSQPQSCPASSDSACSPCLWRKGVRSSVSSCLLSC